MSIEKQNKKNKQGKIKKFLDDINTAVSFATGCSLVFLVLLVGGFIFYYDRIAYTNTSIHRLDENIDRIQKNIALLTAIHVSNTNMDKFDKEYNRNLEKIMCELQKTGNYFNNIEQHCWFGHGGPPGRNGPTGNNIKKKEELIKSDDENTKRVEIKKELHDLLKIIQNKRSEL